MARKTQGRKKGSGTLVRRGTIWFARWTVDGKVFTKTTGTSSKREAEAVLDEFTAPFRLGGEQKTLETLSARVQGVKAEIQKHEDAQPQMTLSQAWDAYLKSPNRPDSSQDTLDHYEQQYSRFLNWVKVKHPETVELRDFTEEQAAEFANAMTKAFAEKSPEYAAGMGAAFSPNTFNKYITLLRRVWKIVGKHAKATINPWEDIKLKLLDTHSRRELTVEELVRVCESVKGDTKVLFAIGIYTGLRLADIVFMKWGNVDLVKRIISVSPRKTARRSGGKLINIPIHPSLMQILSEHTENGRTGYLLPELAAAYDHSTATFQKVYIEPVFRACGIDTQATVKGRKRRACEVGFHSLRHSFVSLCANAGTPLAIVQAIVGHSNPAMTMHYYHEDAKAVKGAIDGLPDVAGMKALPEPPDSTRATLEGIAGKLEGLTDKELADLIRVANAEKKQRLARRT